MNRMPSPFVRLKPAARTLTATFLRRALTQTLLPVVALLLCGLIATPLFAQSTAGGTQIQNRASATYSDGGGNNYSTASNTVTVTVSNVSGLVITPDNGTPQSAVAGQQVRFDFVVTNTGNFADQVRFLANGASIRFTGSVDLTSIIAFIDRGAPGGAFQAGTDIDISGNAADVLSPSIAQNATLSVAVQVTMTASAVNGDTVRVTLGDASADNVAADSSANEVRTVASGSVNGLREAVGDASVQIVNDAQLLLTLTAPTGPVPLGSNISYGLNLSNPGARDAQNVTLTNAPAGSNSGVFVIAPIPVGTMLASGQTFPAGTLYTTSPLTVDPTTAVWTTVPPANLADVRRIAFNTGNSLVAGTSATAINFTVTITTTNATTSIFEIADAFARNSIGTQVTDQSGDIVRNGGDGNADFEEDTATGSSAPQFDGVQQQTLLQTTGSVFVGPSGKPNAVGPTNTNDDYTNKSLSAGLAGVAPGGVTTVGQQVLFTNTLRNAGNSNDTFSITVPSASFPPNFTVEISINGGSSYTTVQPGNGTINLPIAFGQTADILVRVTAPAGLEILRAYPVTIRATSTTTTGAFNETINRLYTGFLRLDKTVAVNNTTGVGTATDAVPGADITYTINYSNISVGGGDSDNVQLTASSIVITEDGNATPNNWGTSTLHVVGATDSRGGTITGDVVGSTLLTDSVPTLGANQSGSFTFKRKIK
ncbi:MAG: hypothetical protein MSG64_13740 [Pyrinomonadaceae bacterium MAG19_C2-C3]|nr:hypothetical protein [Pyrinomonadaceae bacterium MAG19_C2-C3]